MRRPRLGKIDIIAAAQGKIIPSDRSKIVQPFEIRVVRAIHVKDGQTVKAGDVLIELDPTSSDAELRHLQSDLVAAQLDVARLRAALADGDPSPLLMRPTEHPRGCSRPSGSGCSARPSGRPTATIAKIEAMDPDAEGTGRHPQISDGAGETGSKVVYLEN